MTRPSAVSESNTDFACSSSRTRTMFLPRLPKIGLTTLSPPALRKKASACSAVWQTWQPGTGIPADRIFSRLKYLSTLASTVRAGLMTSVPYWRATDPASPSEKRPAPAWTPAWLASSRSRNRIADASRQKRRSEGCIPDRNHQSVPAIPRTIPCRSLSVNRQLAAIPARANCGAGQ